MTLGKNKTVFLYFLLNIALACGALAVMSLFTVNKWVGVSVGIGVIIVSLALCIALKNKFYPYAMVINGLATGITISSLYVYGGMFPSMWQIAAVAVGSVVLFGGFFLLYRIEFVKNHYAPFLICYIAVLLASEIVCAILVDPPSFYLALFMLLSITGHLFVLTREKSKNKLTMNLMWASLSFLIIALCIVLVFVSEGEGFDGFAPDGIADKKNKKGDSL